LERVKNAAARLGDWLLKARSIPLQAAIANAKDVRRLTGERVVAVSRLVQENGRPPAPMMVRGLSNPRAVGNDRQECLCTAGIWHPTPFVRPTKVRNFCG
jgi:hypothetical protein